MKSKVFIEDAVYVHIVGHKKVPSDGMPRFEQADDGVLHRWLQYLLDHIENVQEIGPSSSGLGSYSGSFTAESKPLIEEFFRKEGYIK